MAHSPIVISRPLAVEPDAVFRFLEDLAHHARLSPRSARVLSLERRRNGLDRAVVRLSGPLGMRRTASTELIRTEAPALIAGRAALGAHTRATVTWRIAPAPRGSRVTLAAEVDDAGPLDGLFLRLGGRRWIARRFAAALDELVAQLQAPAGVRPGVLLAAPSRSRA